MGFLAENPESVCLHTNKLQENEVGTQWGKGVKKGSCFI
jgi:hypothetical protein